MPPKKGRPPKTAVPEASTEEAAALVTAMEPESEVPPLGDQEEIKEIAVSEEGVRVNVVAEMYREGPPPAETPLTWRQRIVHEILEEEYRALVRERLSLGTLEVEHPEDREMMREIIELRDCPRPPCPAPAPTPEPGLLAADVPPPAANPQEWAEEFGVLLSTFFQSEKGLNLIDVLERQTKVWLRISQQLANLNESVGLLLDGGDEFEENVSVSQGSVRSRG